MGRFSEVDAEKLKQFLIKKLPITIEEGDHWYTASNHIWSYDPSTDKFVCDWSYYENEDDSSPWHPNNGEGFNESGIDEFDWETFYNMMVNRRFGTEEAGINWTFHHLIEEFEEREKHNGTI